MEVFVGRFGLPVFRAGPIFTALLAIVLSACSGDPGPSADSEQAAAEAKQMLASGGSADGKALYAACVACHGDKAEGNRALGAPSLRNQQDWYLKRQLQQYRAGLRGSHPEDSYGMQMQAIAKTLPDEAAVDAVVAYIAGLGGKAAEATLEGNIKRGADYYSNLCGACHGPAAEGLDVLQAPALAGVDDWYLMRQYQHFRDGLRGADEADKYGYQMAIMARHLSDEAVLTDVLSYIQSLAD
ncbi:MULTISPECIES: c-type cytochrome [Spongiibacter]|uniref:c-type cytochrome n=1 Tax=Spongiibacter TaxID=630749 RepID=UPI000C606EC4|nr:MULTISPECIES: c-type cytochrome [Spongiibacter]MAY38895.1 cytochrome C [Spongiibacter sp.]|tara:strand:+ start:1566 stop:2288 length:723 start_codon:yes stop_codon:yes gene_type:complete